jgi:hypothetical protein
MKISKSVEDAKHTMHIGEHRAKNADMVEHAEMDRNKITTAPIDTQHVDASTNATVRLTSGVGVWKTR